MAGVTAIRDELIERLGGRTDIDARALVWLNDAYFELLLSPMFVFHELDAYYDLVTVDGTRTYALTPITNLWFILFMRDSTNEREIRKSDFKTLSRLRYIEGLPTRYARFSSNIDFEPTPDGAYSIRIFYRVRPNELALGGSLAIGREWEELVTCLAVSKGYEALEQWEKAQAAKANFIEKASMREEQNKLEDMDAEATIFPWIKGY